MKREIKFRDFDFDTQGMRYFDLDGYDRQEHDCYGNIMIYINTTDKNGTGIYEGDIFDINQTVNGQSKFLVFSCLPKLDIRYANDKNREYEYNPYELLDFGVEDKEIEVVGNIHQNPELLSV